MPDKKPRKPRTRNKTIKPFVPEVPPTLEDQDSTVMSSPPAATEAAVTRVAPAPLVENPTVYANGRKAALECFDALLHDTHNIQKLHDSLQQRFDKDPAIFFQELVIPLTPKESLIKMAGDDGNKAPIRIIMTAETTPEPVMPPAPASTQPKLEAAQPLQE